MTPSDLIPLQQSLPYARTLQALNRDVQVLEMADGPPVIALTRRFGPLRMTYLPRADLCGPRARVLAQLPRHHARLILPDRPIPCPRAIPLLTPLNIAELDLPPGIAPETFWSKMHGKWRNRLRRALDGPAVPLRSRFDPDAHAALLAREATQRKERGYRSYPPAFLAAWARINPQNTWLYEARIGHDTVAFMLFLTHGRVATYITGWTGVEGRAAHAHSLLLWSAMQDSLGHGIARIDLGTIDSEAGRPLARFKLGCGARARSLGPTLLVPPGFRVSP